MLKIKNSKRFNNELMKYRRDIEKIPNINVKKECYQLLNNLVEELNYIDAVHDVTNKTIDPTKVRENIERSISLRIKLNQIIKDSRS